MPLYEYMCPECGNIQEIEHSIKDDPVVTCDCRSTNRPRCKRLVGLGNFVLKGSGWAKDGYGPSTKR
jgi:putative FmdB family regulatory protein